MSEESNRKRKETLERIRFRETRKDHDLLMTEVPFFRPEMEDAGMKVMNEADKNLQRLVRPRYNI